MTPPVTPQFENKVRGAMQAFTDDIDAAPDALDRIKAATRAHTNRWLYAGGALAVAATLIAAVATLAALHHAPAKHKVAISGPDKNKNVVVTPTITKRNAKSPPVVADPLPKGAVMLGMKDREILALDAHGKVLKTLVTVFTGHVVVKAQLLADHNAIWYLSEPKTENPGCPEVVRSDLRAHTREVMGHALISR